jgi:hypothetical protein
VLIVLTLFTSGILRQFHEEIPTSPYVSPAAGSLLLGAVLVLLLVAAREHRLGASPGAGIRMGSITPLLLMLLGEKWISLTLYHPALYLLGGGEGPPWLADAHYRAFSGAGLLAAVLLLARLSTPAARQVWRRARPGLWIWAAAGTAVSVVSTYAILGALGVVSGGGPRLVWPKADALWTWTIVGQGLRAFAEEAYFRGLLLFELLRLAPRLGLRSIVARRWTALVLTSVLFGMEHLGVGPPVGVVLRELVFTIALGLLLGIVVVVGSNLHYAAGLHAWINWLLLGAVPRYFDASGESLLPPGTYIGISMALGFVVLFLAVSPRSRST